MEIRHGEAYLAVWLEPPRGCDHLDPRRLEGVLGGEHEHAVVFAVGEGRVWWAALVTKRWLVSPNVVGVEQSVR